VAERLLEQRETANKCSRISMRIAEETKANQLDKKILLFTSREA